jgi:hypothetical protein
VSTPAVEHAPPPPQRRPKGILCPNCGVKLFMRRSFPRRDNSIRRLRLCGGCGYREITYEYPAGARPPALAT